ncbi:SPT3 Dosage dependent suppressor of Ty-induced promoter mutations-like protein [Haplosporangium sp. Z 27]|nr:SPT3 Dosage dependent suppressor of Ty-induced promoter mutations-like protein [Haplosporangium sp. Z 27]
MPPYTATASLTQQQTLGQPDQFGAYLQQQTSDIEVDDFKNSQQSSQQWIGDLLQSSSNPNTTHRLDVKTHVFKKELQEYVPTRSEDHLRIETIIYVDLSIVTQNEGTVVRNYDYARLPKELLFNLPDKIMTQEEMASKNILDVKASVLSPSNGWRVEEETCMRCARRMSAKLEENESRIMHVLPELYRTEDGDALVIFRSGVANLQIKINCYCGHKKEPEGFVVRFDAQSGSFASSHVTTPLMFYHQNKNRIASRALAAAAKAEKKAEKLLQKQEYARARNIVKSVTCNTKRETRNMRTESPRHNPMGHYNHQHILSPPESLMSSPTGYSTSPELHEFIDHSDISSSVRSLPDQMTSLFPELSNEPSVIDPQPQHQLQNQQQQQQQQQQQPISVISHMTPDTGPTRGGTLVTIHGSGFTVGELMYVCFGETFVPIIPQNSQMLECLTPAWAKAESVPVFAFHSIAPTAPPTQCMFTYVDDNEKELIKLALQRIMNISARMDGPLETVMHRANELAMWSELLGTSGGLDETSTQPLPYSSLEKMIMGSFKLLDTPAGKNTEGLSIVNNTGHTMLHLAVALELESLVKDLVVRGIDMTIKDKNGLTALDLAHRFRYNGMINALGLSNDSPASTMQSTAKHSASLSDQDNHHGMDIEWEDVERSRQFDIPSTIRTTQSHFNLQRTEPPGTGWMNIRLGGTALQRDELISNCGQNHDRLLLERQGDIHNVSNCVIVPLAAQEECGQSAVARRRTSGNGGSNDAAEQVVVQSSRHEVESEPVLFLGGQPIMVRGPRSVLSNRQERNPASSSTSSKDEDKVNNV